MSKKVTPFPFDALCGCCIHYRTDQCKYKEITEALTRWETLECNNFQRLKRKKDDHK